jgi:FKBP-type peptidyl-prolyl cis-trans isomerase 2
MRPVRRGDTVTVRYRIRLEKDRLLEPLAKGEWLTITLGTGTLFPALERAIIGMTPGASKGVWLTSEEAYGPYEPERVLTIDRASIPPNLGTLRVGQIFEMSRQNAPQVFVTVKDITLTTVTLDANHPLAGKDVFFEVTLGELVTQGPSEEPKKPSEGEKTGSP